MSSLLLSLLDLHPKDLEALAPEARERLYKTLYAALGSTILGDHPADEEANAAIGHFLAEGLMAAAANRSAGPAGYAAALRERLRPALEVARVLECVPGDTSDPRRRY